MSNIDINSLTDEQVAALRLQLEQKEAKERADREEREADYKKLRSETVNTLWNRLKTASRMLAEEKRYAVSELDTLIGLKEDLYKVRDGQNRHTFINAEGTFRVTIGAYYRDSWDETAGNGEAKIREAIRQLGTDKKTRALVGVILDLLTKDKAGNLKITSVWRLQKYAAEIQDPNFDEGLRIIRDAYRPERTKTFIVAEEKNDIGAWVSIPLGMTEAKEKE